MNTNPPPDDRLWVPHLAFPGARYPDHLVGTEEEKEKRSYTNSPTRACTSWDGSSHGLTVLKPGKRPTAGCASMGNERKGLRSRGGCIMAGGGRRIAGIGPARLRLPRQGETRRNISRLSSNRRVWKAGEVQRTKRSAFGVEQEFKLLSAAT